MKIVIIETDTYLKELLVHAWSYQRGYQVQCFSYGEDFFSSLDPIHPPQILIHEWVLPDMTGFEFTTRLREQTCFESIKVIVFSWHTSQHLENRDTSLLFLKKPFSLFQLMQNITLK